MTLEEGGTDLNVFFLGAASQPSVPHLRALGLGGTFAGNRGGLCGWLPVCFRRLQRVVLAGQAIRHTFAPPRQSGSAARTIMRSGAR